MMKMRLLLLLFAASMAGLQAQQTTATPAPATDSSSLRFAFTHGKVQGQLRYFAMATDNAAGLSDYIANVAGLSMRYETTPFHGFQFAAGGSTHFNLASSDLAARDAVTNQPNRYEIGLLDLENLDNRRDISRLELLSLRYTYKRHSLLVGRQDINTPFINPQDGRMRPTLADGAWLHLAPGKQLDLDLACLYGISPRSTTQWYNPGASIGIYPTGVQATGQPSAYKGQVESRAILIGHLRYQPSKRLRIQLHDMYTDQVFNTAMAQVEWSQALKQDLGLQFGVQAIRQDAVGDGGNADPALTYFNAGGKSHVLGGQVALKGKTWESSLNYTRITADGRYLMPREWGRDPFYTFLPRERNEGFGDVHAMTAKAEKSWKRIRSKAGLGVGYYRLPDVLAFALNKYGQPSYAQMNLDLRHNFGGHLQGLAVQALVVGKLGTGDLHASRRYEFNRVNMMNYNLVLNYNF